MDEVWSTGRIPEQCQSSRGHDALVSRCDGIPAQPRRVDCIQRHTIELGSVRAWIQGYRWNLDQLLIDIAEGLPTPLVGHILLSCGCPYIMIVMCLGHLFALKMPVGTV